MLKKLSIEDILFFSSAATLLLCHAIQMNLTVKSLYIYFKFYLLFTTKQKKKHCYRNINSLHMHLKKTLKT